MTKKKTERASEVTMKEGEIIGHFAEFKEGKVRDFINDEGYKEGTLSMPPRIKGGIFVQMGDRRIPINCRDTEVDLESADKATAAAKKRVLTATTKAYPFGSVLVFKETKYLDNNWKKYRIVGPKEG